MSFSDEILLEDALKVVTAKEEAELSERQKIIGATKGGLWYLQTPGGGWSGPHNVSTLLAFDWLKPDTKIKKMGETDVLNLVQMEGYMRNFTEVLNKCGLKVCPACGGRLDEIVYERIKILECVQCQGLLVSENMIPVLLERTEKVFDARIQKMAKILMQEIQLTKTDSPLSYESDRMYRCDTCKNNPTKMRRRLFNRYYPVEVDKCMACGLTWFDRDELEIMQCIYELRKSSSNLLGSG
jgi:Zn-finger nucleic acid-binding protein